jgi:hypothetical protein
MGTVKFIDNVKIRYEDNENTLMFEHNGSIKKYKCPCTGFEYFPTILIYNNDEFMCILHTKEIIIDNQYKFTVEIRTESGDEIQLDPEIVKEVLLKKDLVTIEVNLNERRKEREGLVCG